MRELDRSNTPRWLTLCALPATFLMGAIVGRQFGSWSDYSVRAPVDVHSARDTSMGERGATGPSAQSGSMRSTRPLVSVRSDAAPAPRGVGGLGGSFESILLAQEMTPVERGILVEMLLSRGRVVEAHETLRTAPADSNEAYLAVAHALSSAGLSSAASEMFAMASKRANWWDDDIVDEFVAHDAGACLVALDIEIARREALQFADPMEDLDEYRAQALQALGRSIEAVAYLESPEDLFVEYNGGCVPAHIRGPRWMWEAWMEIEPRRVEAQLLRVLEGYGSSTTVPALLGKLYLAQGRSVELEAQLSTWRERHGTGDDYGELLVEFAPARGWDEVRDYLQDDPDDTDTLRAFGEHLVEVGRVHDAAELWGASLRRSWEDDQDSEYLAETVALAPQRLSSVLDELERVSLRREQSESDLAWDLGKLGDTHWLLGGEKRAVYLWRSAVRLDPECGWMHELRLVELGVDPLAD